MFKSLRFLVLASSLAFACVGAHAAVIAIGDSANTFGEDDAFSIFNDTSLGITSATLTFTSGGASVWDSNLPSQAAFSFLVNAGSDPTGVSPSFINPAPGGIADFDGYFSLAMLFADFNPGETLIFGADIDGLIFNTGGLAGDLVIDLVFSDGSTGSAIFELVRGELIVAEAVPGVVPEPGSLALLSLALAGMHMLNRRRNR